jgi:hypothetical protein
MSDTYPILPRSMPVYKADIDARRSPSNTPLIVYELLREYERRIPVFFVFDTIFISWHGFFFLFLS